MTPDAEAVSSRAGVAGVILTLLQRRWVSRVSCISTLKYKGKNASLRWINSNYFRIVRYID